VNWRDPLAAWRGNPFFVLAAGPEASRSEIERAGQRLLGLLAVGSASAGRYDTPLGPATRDADGVRQALATLRDPHQRVVHELLADIAQNDGSSRSKNRADPWTAAERALGWTVKWPQ
jgi:hypothetical protein